LLLIILRLEIDGLKVVYYHVMVMTDAFDTEANQIHFKGMNSDIDLTIHPLNEPEE